MKPIENGKINRLYIMFCNLDKIDKIDKYVLSYYEISSTKLSLNHL